MRGFGDYADDDTFSAIKARDWKDHTDLIVEPTTFVLDRASFNQGENAKYEPVIEESTIMPSLVARGPHAVGQDSPVTYSKSRRAQNVDDHETWVESDVAPTLNIFDVGDIRATTAIVDSLPLLLDGRRVDDVRVYTEPVQTLQERMGTGGNNVPVVASGYPTMIVRRLTPLECERLMGWPDGHTSESTNGTVSDTQRYKMCGNGVASPVAQWIGEHIARASGRG
jgi:DNA (cytosine-5)-methyltransferase 1